MTSPTYSMNTTDHPVALKEPGQHQTVSYHDMTAQPRPTEIHEPQSMTFALPYSHFAMMYIDRNGELQVESSSSITGCEKAIFTDEVRQRFVKLVNTEWSSSNLQNLHPGTFGLSSTSLGLQSSWYHPSQPRPSGLIPCEWQSLQNKRQRRNLRRVDSSIGQEWESSSPSPSIKRTALRVGQTGVLRSYYEKAFEYFQQLNCRVIAKAFVKLVEPRKQVNHPYNGRKNTAGSSQRMDPELTKPKWWPTGVTHKEPDHLLKAERIRLLVHILCELRDSHGITAERLKDAGQDVRRQILPAARLQVLDEIYYVREMEELYLDGKISGDTIIHVSHVHLEDELQEQEATDSSHEPQIPVITFQGEPPTVTDNRPSQRDIAISSNNPRPPPLNAIQHPAKRPATQDCYFPISPASSPCISRKSSLERTLPGYSSDLDPSMLSSNEAAAKVLMAAKAIHHPTGPSSIPDYFSHQLTTSSIASTQQQQQQQQHPHPPLHHDQPGFWSSLPQMQVPLTFQGY